MTGDWIVNDGMVPLASAMYPLDEKDNAFSYEQTVESGSIRPGTWYYMKPLYSMDHGDYCTPETTIRTVTKISIFPLPRSLRVDK